MIAIALDAVNWLINIFSFLLKKFALISSISVGVLICILAAKVLLWSGIQRSDSLDFGKVWKNHPSTVFVNILDQKLKIYYLYFPPFTMIFNPLYIKFIRLILYKIVRFTNFQICFLYFNNWLSIDVFWFNLLPVWDILIRILHDVHHEMITLKWQRWKRNSYFGDFYKEYFYVSGTQIR